MAEKSLEKFRLPEVSDSDEMFLSELSSTIGKLANQHLESEIEYFPYDFVDKMDEAIASGDLVPEEAPLDEAVKQSLFVNLLTEEGLPEYTSTIQRRIPKKHPLLEWSHLWTADEGRHGPTISGFLHKTKQFSMQELERARMAMMRYPDTPQPGSIIESFIYPAIQEPATEIAHRNTMNKFPKAHIIGRRAMGAVIRDEIRHGKFYREATAAALEVDPSTVIIALARQIKDFAMPGKSIPGFNERAKAIDAAGIFGFKHIRQIYENLAVNRLNIFSLENLTPDAEKAREIISRQFQRMDKALKRQERHAQELAARPQQ